MSKVKIGLIGAGNIANAHLEAYRNVPDAEIWINGEMVGKTPAVLDALPADKPLELELKKTGYKTFHKQIVLTKNNLLEVDFILNKKR